MRGLMRRKRGLGNSGVGRRGGGRCDSMRL